MSIPGQDQGFWASQPKAFNMVASPSWAVISAVRWKRKWACLLEEDAGMSQTQDHSRGT